jgi:MFS family permease
MGSPSLYPDVSNESKQPLLVNADEEYEEELGYPKENQEKTYYEAAFVVLPVFCGYACLFALQREIKQVYHIKDDDSELAHLYGVAASLVYIGNLVLRLGHNVVFSYFYPRTRVVISMISMGISMGIITCICFFMKNPHLAWVFIAYALGGIGIGTFESNLLSTIAPLGKRTKLWAIIGIPVGINIITVGGFILLEVGLPAGYIFLGVLIFDMVGIGLFFWRIWKDAGTGNAITLFEFFHQIKQWRHWFPQIKWHSLALMIDMLGVSMFSPGVMLYIYDQPYISFKAFRLQRDWLFAIYDACFFIGDTSSRKIFYQIRTIFPLLFLVFTLIGAAAGLSNIIFIVFICPILVAFCNGSIYSQANRHIDTKVPKEYSLIAFSFWLFLGDIGSVIGSNLISYVNVEVKRLYH